MNDQEVTVFKLPDGKICTVTKVERRRPTEIKFMGSSLKNKHVSVLVPHKESKA